PVSPDHLPHVDRQQGKQRGRLGTRQPDRAPVAHHLDGPQQPHLHAGDDTPVLRRRRALTSHTPHSDAPDSWPAPRSLCSTCADPLHGSGSITTGNAVTGFPPSAHRRTTMTLALGDTAPDFQAETTEGPIRFHEWIGDSWAVLFSHPKDFTPVCTTELGYMAHIKPAFGLRNVKVMGLSVDSADDHRAWAKDIEETQGDAPNYPIIADADYTVAKLYGMLPAETSGECGSRTPADNQTVRNVFVIGPDKKVKLILVYPMTTGRNFEEGLRVIDSLPLTAKHRAATPVNWRQGEDVIIAGSVPNDEARQIFGEWREPKPYIRIVPQPT